MTSVLSPDEWRGLIQEAENNLEHTSAPPRESTAPEQPDAGAIAGSIDHTLLKLDVTYDQINRRCSEAKRYAFKVPPS